MSHSFEVKHLPEDTAIMMCRCGLTYRWYRNIWKLVGFEDQVGRDIDPPSGQCDKDKEVESEEEESEND
jgi:hypothetical protein